jgi:hypothetical protein
MQAMHANPNNTKMQTDTKHEKMNGKMQHARDNARKEV